MPEQQSLLEMSEMTRSTTPLQSGRDIASSSELLPLNVHRSPGRIRAWTSRIIGLICLTLLFTVMVAVIYGLFLRAYFERSYYIAAIFAVVGALVIIVGLAQQAIAARDSATWRDMAVWQIRAATDRLERTGISRHVTIDELLGQSEVPYYDHLIESLIEGMVLEERDLHLDED
jgi:hypothetical protein